MGAKVFNLSVTAPSAKAGCSQGLTPFVLSFTSFRKRGGGRKDASGPTGVTGWSRCCPWTFLSCRQADQAGTRQGSSTMEKRTPALCRFSSETARQASSASLRVLNGPWTWAEPSTSLWKFIETNSPPITQKFLPVVMISLLLFSCLNVDFRTVRLELRGFGRVVKRCRR